MKSDESWSLKMRCDAIRCNVMQLGWGTRQRPRTTIATATNLQKRAEYLDNDGYVMSLHVPVQYITYIRYLRYT